MKKFLVLVLALVLAASVSLSAGALGMAEQEIPVIDAETHGCPDQPHIHDEDLVPAAYVIAPFGSPVHCEKGDVLGRILQSTSTSQIGYENRQCAHGRVGGIDARYQYLKVISGKCTLCAYTYTIATETYWGSWICQ